MLLRESAKSEQITANLDAVTGDEDTGIPHGQVLKALTDALINNDGTLIDCRNAAIKELGIELATDALVVASAFNGITRVADATGISLDPSTESNTRDLREHTGINNFRYEQKSQRYDSTDSP